MQRTTELCDHGRLAQRSVVHALTYWSRGAAGGYQPEPAGEICLSKILVEETEGWECLDCGAELSVDADGAVSGSS
jgi:hypothetical protein